jgi:hypothetical protein
VPGSHRIYAQPSVSEPADVLTITRLLGDVGIAGKAGTRHPTAGGVLALPTETAHERLICVVCAGSDDTDECAPIRRLRARLHQGPLSHQVIDLAATGQHDIAATGQVRPGWPSSHRHTREYRTIRISALRQYYPMADISA